MSRSGRRGFSLRRKLLLFTLLLLPLPWLVYQYIGELKTFLIAGQENAQALTAQAIATALHERADLFSVADDAVNPFDESQAFYAYPLPAPLQLDGYAEDWGALTAHSRHYGAAATQYHSTDRPASIGFDLVMGVHDKTLYGFMQVEDDTTVYRHPGYRRLDNSDHLRLAIGSPTGQIEHYVMLAEAPGNLSVYAVGPDWKYATDGKPVYAIAGILQPRADGYDIEFRIPLTRFGRHRGLYLAVADVDDRSDRQVKTVLGTLPATGSGQLNHLVLRSPELERILQGLQRAQARVWIVDRLQRVRAMLGGPGDDSPPVLARRNDAAVTQALAGNPALIRRPVPEGEGQRIIAAHPIAHGADVLGAVVVEQTTQRILSLQKSTLERLTLMSAGLLGLTLLALTLFSMRLTYRIHRLSEQTRAAIDAQGRILQPQITAEARARDEFGTLSRSISDILQRLGRYTGFLEKMPRMLRHEINNPLNVISTSLENLLHTHPELRTERTIQSTERGIARIQDIVRALTEAASLEESLRSETPTRFNLTELVTEYVNHIQAGQPDCPVEGHIAAGEVCIEGNDFRIEQLLDKLLDNACDYCSAGGAVEVTLTVEGNQVRLSVTNPGPPIPDVLMPNLFDLMISGRSSSGADTHLGIGLYAVRLIAEFHHGSVAVENRPVGSGVSVHVILPRCDCLA